MFEAFDPLATDPMLLGISADRGDIELTGQAW